MSPASVDLSFVAGDATPFSVTATASGTVEGNLYVTIIDTVGVIQPTVQLSAISETAYRATFTTATTVQPGTHTGSFRVNVCYDTSCSRHVGNSPLTLPYTFHVTARNTFAVAPALLTTSPVVGSSAPLSVTLTPSQTITAPVGSRLVDMDGDMAPGLTITSSNGVYTASFSTSPNLIPGRHTGSVRIDLCRDSVCFQSVHGSPVTVPYQIDVQPRAASSFSIAPATVTANYVVGTTGSLSLTVTPSIALNQPLFVRIGNSGGTLQPQTSVQSNGAGTSFTVHAQTSDTIAAGHYTGSMDVELCSNADCTGRIVADPIAIPYVIDVLPPLTIEPATLTGRFAAGFRYPIKVKAIRNNKADLYVSVADAADTIQLIAGQSFSDPYTLTFHASPMLTAGRKQGEISINVCRDQQCAQPVPGSPLRVPFDFTVEPLDAQVALGVADWEMYQGNAAHTGHVPVVVNVDDIVPRWSWTTSDSTNGNEMVSHVAVSDGRVFVSAVKRLYALSENDGSPLWQKDFNAEALTASDSVKLNPPAASGGNAYVATSGHGGTYLWGFEANSGAELFHSSFGAQWNEYLAPTVHAGSIYVSGDYSLSSFAEDGTPQFTSSLPMHDVTAPAADANNLYSYIPVDRVLHVRNRMTGTLINTVDEGDPGTTYAMYSAPVLGSAGSVFVTRATESQYQTNTLSNLDAIAFTRKWSESGRYSGTPAYASGVVYAVNLSPLRLEARNEVDGVLLWSWDPTTVADYGFEGDVLVTDNLVFVSGKMATYAIDIATREPVWSYPKSGRLALSANGVLYISSLEPTGKANDGDVVAIDVK